MNKHMIIEDHLAIHNLISTTIALKYTLIIF